MRQYNPPRIMLRFFRWFCHPELLKYIEGDLMELYDERVEEFGKQKADRMFVVDVVLLFRRGIIRTPKQNESINHYGMYKSHIKFGWRNLLKNKGHFAINIAGLALGIATCLIISMFVFDELSYDRYNKKAGQMVRVVLRGNVNGEIIKEAVTPAPVGPTLKAEFPEVEQATRLRRMGQPKIKYANNTFKNSKVAFVDPNFFEVFTIPLLKGDIKSVLAEPNAIVITQEEAVKYFGDEDPINKVLEFVDQGKQYVVTGTIDQVPTNSHFHFDMFVSMAGLDDARNDNWMASNYFNYLVLARGTDIRDFESKLPDIIAKYMGPQFDQMEMSYEKFKEKGNSIGIFVQPVTDIHLYSDFADQTELEPGGDIKAVYIFAAVAIFMLLIACINFMNLATAAATRRRKEVGVKKVLGSQRSQLVQQFLTESFIATLLALFIALIIVVVALPFFNELSGKNLVPQFLLNPEVVAVLGAFLVLITLMAGGYPAFFLSTFAPISALRPNGGSNRRGKGVRGALVVFQFVISAGLIVSIIIVNQQMSYIQNKNIGYDRDQMLVLRESYLLGSNESVFRNQILEDPLVSSVTRSAFVPAGPTDNNMTAAYPGQQTEAIRRILIYNIDAQYIPTMGMKLVKGRNFSEFAGSDSSHVIINETAAKAFGFGDNPIGETLVVNTGNQGEKRRLSVIGVIKDFHFRSLHESIAPLMMLNRPYGGLIIRTKTKNMAGLIESLAKKWKAFQVEEPFSYALLNDLYNETYLAEQKMGDVLNIFGFITIFVACLGLFGLVTFTAEQRVKEIGIRKVLGANVGQIVSLLSTDLILLVGISFVIAFPLGFYLMDKWLQDFSYRIEIKWSAFALAGVITILIAFITMSFKTIRAALANPVDSLRTE